MCHYFAFSLDLDTMTEIKCAVRSKIKLEKVSAKSTKVTLKEKLRVFCVNDASKINLKKAPKSQEFSTTRVRLFPAPTEKSGSGIPESAEKKPRGSPGFPRQFLNSFLRPKISGFEQFSDQIF